MGFLNSTVDTKGEFCIMGVVADTPSGVKLSQSGQYFIALRIKDDSRLARGNQVRIFARQESQLPDPIILEWGNIIFATRCLVNQSATWAIRLGQSKICILQKQTGKLLWQFGWNSNVVDSMISFVQTIDWKVSNPTAIIRYFRTKCILPPDAPPLADVMEETSAPSDAFQDFPLMSLHEIFNLEHNQNDIFSILKVLSIEQVINSSGTKPKFRAIVWDGTGFANQQIGKHYVRPPFLQNPSHGLLMELFLWDSKGQKCFESIQSQVPVWLRIGGIMRKVTTSYPFEITVADRTFTFDFPDQSSRRVQELIANSEIAREYAAPTAHSNQSKSASYPNLNQKSLKHNHPSARYLELYNSNSTDSDHIFGSHVVAPNDKVVLTSLKDIVNSATEINKYHVQAPVYVTSIDPHSPIDSIVWCCPKCEQTHSVEVASCPTCDVLMIGEQFQIQLLLCCSVDSIYLPVLLCGKEAERFFGVTPNDLAADQHAYQKFLLQLQRLYDRTSPSLDCCIYSWNIHGGTRKYAMFGTVMNSV